MIDQNVISACDFNIKFKSVMPLSFFVSFCEVAIFSGFRYLCTMEFLPPYCIQRDNMHIHTFKQDYPQIGFGLNSDSTHSSEVEGERTCNQPQTNMDQVRLGSGKPSVGSGRFDEEQRQLDLSRSRLDPTKYHHI